MHPEVVYFEREKEEVVVEIAMQYSDAFNETLFSFANTINTIEGGTHLSGFRSALTRTVNSYAKQNKLIKDEKQAMGGEDIREGLTAVISVKIPDPQFEGQTKTKLGNGEVEGSYSKSSMKSWVAFLRRIRRWRVPLSTKPSRHALGWSERRAI